jgi:hypothetical protein
LPNVKGLLFNNENLDPTIISGKPLKEILKIELDEKLFPEEIFFNYENLSLLTGLNEKYKSGRWPFVEGLNTTESSYMHYLLGKEKIRPLYCFFQNDFYCCFKDNPSRTELTKRA